REPAHGGRLLERALRGRLHRLRCGRLLRGLPDPRPRRGPFPAARGQHGGREPARDRGGDLWHSFLPAPAGLAGRYRTTGGHRTAAVPRRPAMIHFLPTALLILGYEGILDSAAPLAQLRHEAMTP